MDFFPIGRRHVVYETYVRIASDGVGRMHAHTYDKNTRK